MAVPNPSWSLPLTLHYKDHCTWKINILHLHAYYENHNKQKCDSIFVYNQQNKYKYKYR